MAKTASKINYTPPKAVQNACKKGLSLKGTHGGKGLRAPTVEWAQHFADGKPNDAAHARKMRAWFSRHDVDQRPGWDKPPTPGYVARLLWGGDAGQRWVTKLVDQIERADAAEKDAKKARPTRAAKKSAAGGAGKKKAGAKKRTKKTSAKAASGKKAAASQKKLAAAPARKKAAKRGAKAKK